MTPRPRILCVDDSEDLGAVLLRLIAAEPDLEPAAHITTAADLPAAIERHRADAVLLDLSIPGCDPIAELEATTRAGSPCRVIVMSGYDDQDTIDAAKDAGAAGFISKSVDPAAIPKAIRRALTDQSFTIDLG